MTFKVTIREVEIRTLLVEADSEEEARSMWHTESDECGTLWSQDCLECDIVSIERDRP